MRLRRICETIHLTALGIWLGSLLMTGVAAAVIFPTMRDQLRPALGAFPEYTGEAWALGAGIIASKIFAANDIVQFVCAFLAFATLGMGLMMWERRSASGAVRAISVGLAMALVSYWLFILAPQMDQHMRAFWQAASAGDNEAAGAAKGAFDGLHPIATKVMAGQAGLVFVSLIAGCWSAMGPAREQHDTEGAGRDGES